MKKPLTILIANAAILFSQTLKAEEVIFTDTFDSGLSKWIINYDWKNNIKFTGNHKSIEITDNITLTQGGRIETALFKLEPGFRYKCTLKVKSSRHTPHGTRIQFFGYRWAPGISPTEHPKPEELRLIYKSKAHQAYNTTWNEVTLELPGVELSYEAIRHLKNVRFLTLCVWTEEGCSIDDVVITKTHDPSMQF